MWRNKRPKNAQLRVFRGYTLTKTPNVSEKIKYKNPYSMKLYETPWRPLKSLKETWKKSFIKLSEPFIIPSGLSGHLRYEGYLKALKSLKETWNNFLHESFRDFQRLQGTFRFFRFFSPEKNLKPLKVPWKPWKFPESLPKIRPCRPWPLNVIRSL